MESLSQHQIYFLLRAADMNIEGAREALEYEAQRIAAVAKGWRDIAIAQLEQAKNSKSDAEPV